MEINFGKYKGITVDYIYNTDKEYFEWLSKKGNQRQKGIKEYCLEYIKDQKILQNEIMFLDSIKNHYLEEKKIFEPLQTMDDIFQ